MAETVGRKKHSAPRRLLKAVGGGLLALIVIGGVYLAAVLLQDPEENAAADAGLGAAPRVSRMQSAAMEDPAALARMFEAPLPYLPGQPCRGEAGNAAWDGQTARLSRLFYDGLTVSAVQPAAAAPLLLYGEMSVSLKNDLTVLGLPAMLAEKGNSRCLYFSNETAAYAVYAPDAEAEALLSLAQRLEWAQ